MVLNMIKLCVGVDTVEDLESHVAMRLAAARAAGLPAEQTHRTRVRPKRADEILGGGSLYWVIKGNVQLRQPIRRFDAVTEAEVVIVLIGFDLERVVGFDLDLTLIDTAPGFQEVLRALVEAEIAARDASNIRNRLKTAGFPVTKTLESFDVAASSIPANTFDYLSSLEWVRAQHNLALTGPAGTGKSHTLIGLGIAAVHAGHKVRYFTAADLVETLYRGLADNTVGKTIDTLLRQDLIILDEVGFAPLDDTGTQLLFRLVAGAYERRSLAIASHWPFEQWGRFLPEQTTAVSILDRLLHHATVVITDGDSYRMTHRTEVPPT